MRKYFNCILLIMITIIVLFTSFFIKFQLSEGGLCIADGIRKALDVRYSTRVITLFTIYYLYITRDEFNLMMLVRMNSKRKIWNNQMINSLVASFIFSIIVIGISLAFAVLFYRDGGIINWNQYYSDYSIMSRGYVSSIGLGYVLFKGVVLLVLQTEICLIFSQLVIWLTNIRILPLVVIIAAVIGDAHSFYIPIFFSRFNYILYQWGDMQIQSMQVIGWLILLALLLYAIGYWYSEHKEFIGEEHA